MATDVIAKADADYQAWQTTKNAAADRAVTQSKTGIDGNSYTTKVSNDKLTNDDFLRLMLEEMKMQDPTKPMDSAALMDSQLKMSTIESNQDMAKAMTTMQSAYANSALSTAANMIGHVVEDGQIGSTGVSKEYKVKTVENQNGELYLTAYEITGVRDSLINNDTEKYVTYDTTTGTIQESGENTPYSVVFDSKGRFELNADGSIKLVNSDGNVVTDNTITQRYTSSTPYYTYSQESTRLSMSNVVAVK